MASHKKGGAYRESEAFEETEFPVDQGSPTATATATDPGTIVRPAIPVRHPEDLVDEITAESEATVAAPPREDEGHDPISNGEGGNESASIEYASPSSMESGDAIGGEGGLAALEDVPDFDEQSLLNRQESSAIHETRLVDAYYASATAEEFFPALGALLPAVAKGAISTFGPTVVRAALKNSRIRKHFGAATRIASSLSKFLETSEEEPTLLDPESEAVIREVVLGTDDRIQINATTAPPWSRICSLLITTRTGQQFIGTGFLISPGTVITAGHCVYVHRYGGWAARIQVMPGRNADSRPFGECTATAFRSVRGWVSRESRDHDYGAIMLPKSFYDKTRPLGAFGFAALPNPDLLARWVNTAGYPGDKPRGTMWWHARRLTAVTPRTLVYDIDTAGGQSGSAVWLKKDGRRIVVGIHTNGAPSGNSATRITTSVFNNLRRWREQGM